MSPQFARLHLSGKKHLVPPCLGPKTLNMMLASYVAQYFKGAIITHV